ncbi:MAG: FAD-binding oxidoreductase [Solirubrobacteraceae bacterium]
MEAGAELIARARLVCGEQHVLTGATVLSSYRSDGIRRNGPLPLAVILPGSSSEVASVVAACAAAAIPYVVRGAGTSHGGGALPRADSVSIVLTRMRRILAASGSELTAEAGVPLTGLPRSAARSWLDAEELLGTVGGHVAETRDISNIAAIDLVRPDGTLVHLDARAPGYDVVGAFSGSRGRAGIAVTITLKAVPRP